MKFSHSYLKFNGAMPKRAFLLLALKVKREDLSEAFVKFDTEYVEAGQRSFYPLPFEGELILIILVDESRKVFTTVRSFDPEKFDYYKGLEGKWVPVERG